MVSDKDIRAHEGLVRCGNCYSVFNSSWNLTDDPRNDFIEEAASTSKNGLPDNRSSGFTFNIMDNAVDTAAATQSGVGDPAKGDKESRVHQDGSVAGAANVQAPDTDLEPFPQPELDDSLSPPSVPVANNDQEGLLYFDVNDEDGEIDVVNREVTPIEDLTILQTPSFSNEISALDQDGPALKSEFDDEPVMGSLSAESMWPDSEAKIGSDEELDLPATSGDEDTTVAGEADVAESPSVSSDEEAKVDTPIPGEPSAAVLPTDGHDVEIPVASDPMLGTTMEDELVDDSVLDDAVAKDETLLKGEEDARVNAVVTGAENDDSILPLENNEGGIPPEQSEKMSGSLVADDTFSVAGDMAETSEFFSIESLPKTADEAFSQVNEAEDLGASVFITSDEDEIDEAYVPISLKGGEEDKLFHGLDDFPEPGELSALNYEDTMEINAMLEEANISKEQIESALSAAELEDEENANGYVEEILLSSDANNDLTEAIFSTDEEDRSDLAAAEGRNKDRTKPVASFFKNLIPLGLGQKKAWKEPAIADDQTQLIKSLNRSRNQSELPVWVGKYGLTAAISVLVIILLVQVGYFYMDKLVRITPLRPLLEAGCKISGCTVPKIQNIGEIDQLSSRLTPLAGRDGGFKVSSILVSRGIRSQSFPALELTLTDRAGNMISRRVVTRDKYLAKEKSTVMMPNEAVDINIRFRTPSIRVDGFELRPVSQNWLERSK